jgi:YQGE family putative transporter
MRNSNEASMVASYQLAIYLGTPLAFLINGILLERLGVKTLYAMGMLLSGLSLLMMMSSPLMTIGMIALSGFLMGIATGLFWANRDYLALITTNDQNRNYFYGMEISWYTLASVVVPASIGWFISSASNDRLHSGGANGAYRVVAIGACILAAIASIVLCRGRFRKPKQPRFIYFRFHRAWVRMLGLAALFGLGQGYLATAPALLVLMLVGKEGALGAIVSMGGVVSAIALYVIGRTAKVQHRLMVFSFGLVMFLIGSIVNTTLFNAFSVLVFMGFLVVAKSALQWAYYPIEMGTIDVVSAVERRNNYAYIFNHELGLLIGRALGCGTFIVLARCISDVAALRIALPSVVAVQLLAIPLAKRILRANRELESTPTS